MILSYLIVSWPVGSIDSGKMATFVIPDGSAENESSSPIREFSSDFTYIKVEQVHHRGRMDEGYHKLGGGHESLFKFFFFFNFFSKVSILVDLQILIKYFTI